MYYKTNFFYSLLFRVSSIKSEQKAAPAREKTTQAASSAQTTAKVKSFADMVRMQRPEATRKWKETNRQRQLLEEKEKQMARQEALIRSAAVQDHNLQKDKAKEYGNVFFLCTVKKMFQFCCLSYPSLGLLHDMRA